MSVNETTKRTTIYNNLHDLENQLRINEQWLNQAHRDVISYQAKVNHDRHQIAVQKEILAAMDGENK